MLLFVLRLYKCFFTPEELAYRALAHRTSSVGCCWMLVQNGWNSVRFLVPLSASQTPVLWAPAKSLRKHQQYLHGQGNCQLGQFLWVALTFYFSCPFLKVLVLY